jgi:signal peptidase I
MNVDEPSRPPGRPWAFEDLPYARDTGPAEVEQSGRRARVRSAVEWVAIIVGAFLVAFLIKTFLLQAFTIPSESMEATLAVGDRVLVNKLSYKLHDVHRGDLVVFDRPPSESSTDVDHLIKRVVALGGETIEAREGRIYIDDRPLDEPYIADGEMSAEIERMTVPDGHVFVMGDNRDDSRDSRVFGPIPESLIVGRAFIRVWPLPNISLL